MLTDMIVEEEFEIKEEEPWYDHQDLEHDLHLAAELGKTLLDRNRELEQAMQQMYTTNQEQLQEIEYLSKQVELLRQMNEQHAKVYEQLDVTARELEKGNQQLVVDNRSAQQRIHNLTETIDGLQTHVDDLQLEVQGLKSQTHARQDKQLSAQSTPCINDLYHRYSRCALFDDSCVDGEDQVREHEEQQQEEEENMALRRSVQTLQTQLDGERLRRREAEQEAGVLAQENDELERRVEKLQGCETQLQELEDEVEELRSLWRAGALHDGGGAEPEAGRCPPRVEVTKQRGISLLTEVDAQYSALQLKYEELLRHCQFSPDASNRRGAKMPPAEDDGQTPEYKALFQEIFSRIRKTKEDLSENRGTPAQ